MPALAGRDLVAMALGLGARCVPGWSPAEETLARGVRRSDATSLREAIARGEDPLGEAFCALRSPVERRGLGATYTPPAIVRAMLAWTQTIAAPDTIVDPGAGSGRYLVAAGRLHGRANLVGVEIDPLAALLARAHLAASGLAGRSRIVVADYRDFPRPAGRTLFIGNPPYVRHHRIAPAWKRWLTAEARDLGLRASQLAGLHVHFFLRTAAIAREGDAGAFITAAEWLDVNYGSVVRELLLRRLGARSIHIIDPRALPFADAATTAAITCFEVGHRGPVRFRRVESLGDLGALEGGAPVSRARLEKATRWSHLGRKRARAGWVELGELCRVHRGQVTGANRVWIAGPHSERLPASVLYPAVTRARELFQAAPELRTITHLRRVIDLPEDLDALPAAERDSIEAFLQEARKLGADQGFIARHRRAWWSVGLREPAPILATYMARRAPAFVRNFARARHINIAHGLYPRVRLDERMLTRLVEHLAGATSVTDGRTYAGGLTKFEPREMERLLVPGPELLAS